MVTRKTAYIMGISVPIALIIAIIVIIQLPKYWAPKPDYVFAYVTSNKYIYYSQIKIKDNKMTVKPRKKRRYGAKIKDLNFFVYDYKENKPRPMTYEETEKLSFYEKKKSPDGFRVRYSRYASGTLLSFFIYRSFGKPKVYIQGYGISHALNIDVYPKQKYFRFIGWIKR